MNRKTVHLILSALLVLLVVCFIFSNSLLDGEDSSRQSGLVMKFLRAILDPNHTIGEETFHYFVRKGAHFSEFALLGLSLCVLMRCIQGASGKYCPGFMLLAALGTAVADEFIQSFTGRTSSVADVVLDFSGAVTGFTLMLILFALKITIKEKKYAAKKCGAE